MWSDNRKRLTCRLIFLGLCAMPTLLVGYFIFHRPTAADWQQRIQSQLGVHTRIDSIETPGPYETVLRGLTFFDDEGTQILAATEVRVLLGPTNSIQVNHPARLTSDGLQHIIERVNQHLVKSHRFDRHWVVAMKTAVVQSSVAKDPYFDTPQELRLTDLVVHMNSLPNATTCELSFVKADPTTSTPAGQPNRIRCSLHRRTTGELSDEYEAATQLVKLDTDSNALPCWLASTWLPQLAENLGTEVTFQGRLELDAASPDLPGKAWGHFDEVDLQQAMGTPSPPEMRWGSIDIEQFEFRGNEVQHVAYLTIPNSDLPRTQLDKPLQAIERFDVSGSIRNAALQSQQHWTKTY